MKTKKLVFGKFALLIFIAITIPAAIQTAVYFVQAETYIREELLGKTNESIDDKATKIAKSLNETLYLVNLHQKEEDIYGYFDHKYESKFDFLVLYQDKLINIFKNKSRII